MKLYHELKNYEFLSGTTLDTINIELTQTDADGKETPYDTSGKTMRVIVAKVGSTSSTALDKECTKTDKGFSVEITSAETAEWNGRYTCHFALYDSGGLVKRVAYGYFDVLPVPFGGGE